MGHVAAAKAPERLAAIGRCEVFLGGTIGVGTPLRALGLVERVARDVPVERLALHFRDP